MGAKETIREKSALGLFEPLANKHTVLKKRNSRMRIRISNMETENSRLKRLNSEYENKLKELNPEYCSTQNDLES